MKIRDVDCIEFDIVICYQHAKNYYRNQVAKTPNLLTKCPDTFNYQASTITHQHFIKEAVVFRY